MSSLAELPDLVGFFSYSRRDDEHSGGALSRLRARIYDELRLQLGRDLRLWQDTAAIAHGTQWSEEIKAAIAESAFFIPIVTPSAVASEHCRLEFRAFVEREGVLGRADLVFPILYIRVPALQDEAKVRENAVLEMVHYRQYADWTKIRLQEVGAFEVARQVEGLCQDIVTALERPWTAPEKPRERPSIEVLRAPADAKATVAADAAPAILVPEQAICPEHRAQAAPDERPTVEARAEATRRREALAATERIEREQAEREQAEKDRAEIERAGRERVERERAEEIYAFELARRAKTVLGIEVFLAAYPNGHLVGEAEALRTALEARDRAYAGALAKGDQAALEAFLKAYPAAVQADDVRERVRKLHKRRALVSVLAALGVVAVVAIGVGVIWFATREDDLAICAKADGSTAMAACTRVIEDSNASPSTRVAAYNGRGAMYGSQHQNDEAIADFTQALKLDPNSVTAYVKRGGVYEAKGEHDHAIDDLSAAIRLDAKNVQAHELRGDAYVSQHKYDQAIADYTRVLEVSPGSGSVLRKRAGAHMAKGDDDHAVADLGEAIRLDPKNAEAYALRAEANFNLKKYDAAIADADQALKLDTKSVVARLNRGKAYQAKGSNDQAIADLTEAIRGSDSLRSPGQVWTTASVSPDSRLAEAYLYRGNAYLAKNDNDTAIADYTQAIQLNSKLWSGYFYRARAYNAKHDYDRAVADWTRLILVMPDVGGLYRERGVNYFATKYYDRAMADFNEAIKLDSKDAWAYLGRGLTKRARGDDAGGNADIATARRLNPRITE
jgi:tetratricopeptide (TPR) repeat protein